MVTTLSLRASTSSSSLRASTSSTSLRASTSSSSLRGAQRRSNPLNDLKELVEARFHLYYPEFGPEDISVRSRLLKKGHKSMVYQFDVYNSRHILKSLIVKKRVYNVHYNNQILENTRKEFEALKFLNNVTGAHIPVPRVLDIVPDTAVLVTEKVDGESLYHFLSRNAYLPISESKKTFAKEVFFRTGEWLRNFHNATVEGKEEKIDTQEFIGKAEAIVAKFPSMGLSPDLGVALIDKMRKMENKVLQYTFPAVLKHGDFQPRNIMFSKNAITVVDIDIAHRDLGIKDVCNFINGVNTFDIKNLYSFWSKNLRDELMAEFLKAYFNSRNIPHEAIEFVRSLGLLEQLDSTYQRNRNIARRKVIRGFYLKEIKTLVLSRSLVCAESIEKVNIEGVVIKPIKVCSDNRGWLLECFRHDEMPKDIHPAMSYVSMTKPGVARGPHAHYEQTDYFCFIGPSTFKLFLWDNRPNSATYGEKMVILVGENNPAIAIIPPHVVHAYKNVGSKEGLVLNFPNKLYAGQGKSEPVDEIRYENDVNCKFKID